MPSMDVRQRIYLDNAATSWPKPVAVYEAVDRYQRELGAPVGRGTYREAAEVERLVRQARTGIARLLGVDDARRIAFMPNCTAALNTAIHGMLRPGDRVVTSVVEHNSVLRPLREQEIKNEVAVVRVGCDSHGVIDVEQFETALSAAPARLVAINHASNVTGTIQPIARLAALAHAHGALVLVDVAQSLGHIPLTVSELGADLLAAPGHKGLLGPLGTGFLYVGPGAERELETLLQGGTGTISEQDRQPSELPERFEAGNLNAPGLVGLAAAVDYLETQTLGAIALHVRMLRDRLVAGLAAIEGLTLYGGERDNAGIVSLTIAGYDPQEVAGILDTTYHIQGRSGLHCAPLMHETLGTLPSGGTYRLSIGPFNTGEQIDQVVAGLNELAAARMIGS